MCVINAEKEQEQEQARGKEFNNASRASAPKLTFSSISTNSSDHSCSSSQGTTNEWNSNDNSPNDDNVKNINASSEESSNTFPSLRVILLWSILTFVSKEFSVFLPKFQSHAGAKTFIPAGYHYDAEHTFFDNTILTWGTDYAICIIMLYAAYLCLRATTPLKILSRPAAVVVDPCRSRSLRIKSACLFLSYAISVFAGGYAHYTFTGGVDQLNTLAFRIWWSICVGSVTAAGGFMGACGSEICKRMHGTNRGSGSGSDSGSGAFHRLVHVPDVLWVIYGGYMTWVCLMGGMSYKRPACDIFVAGTSQFVPTAYCILAVGSVSWEKGTSVVHQAIRRLIRGMFYVGFALNAPLLPSYPCFIQYTSLSLGVVNAILHLNLTLAWGMQASSLRHICQAFNLVEHVEEESLSGHKKDD
jgi:hypothetical protein